MSSPAESPEAKHLNVVLVTFIFTTLIHEPASIVTLLAILLLGTALDFGWKRARAGRPGPIQVGH